MLELLTLLAGHMGVHCIILPPFLRFTYFYNKKVEKTSKIQVPALPQGGLFAGLGRLRGRSPGQAAQGPGAGSLPWPGSDALARCLTADWD